MDRWVFRASRRTGKFAWRGGKQTVEEVINLGGIDGEKGKAGMQMFPTLIVGALYHTH